MFACKYCQSDYSSYSHYKTHVATKKHRESLAKLSISNNTIAQSSINSGQITQTQESTQPEEQSGNFKCKCCNKVLVSKFSLKRHYKICKVAQDLIDENTMNIIDNLLESKKIADDKQNITIVINNNTNNINNTNTTNNINNTNNNNLNIELSKDDPDAKYNAFYGLWNRYNVNPFGYENLSMLDDPKVADRIHSGGLNAFTEFIHALYSDKKNHNVALYNQREKLVKYLHSGGKVKITTLEKMMSDLVMNCIDGLDRFLDRKDISIRKCYKNIIDKLKLIHEQDGENPYIDKYLDALKLVILNISSSALETITAIEKAITKDVADLEQSGKIIIPSSALRLDP